MPYQLVKSTKANTDPELLIGVVIATYGDKDLAEQACKAYSERDSENAYYIAEERRNHGNN